MPTIPACIELRAIIQTQFIPISNLFYYVGSPLPTTITALEDIGNAIQGHWAPQLMAVYGDDVTLIGCLLSLQTGTGSSLESQTSVASVPGTIADVSPGSDDPVTPDDLPSETALVFKKLTGIAGRQHRGRWFFGGISEQVNRQGEIDASYRTAALSLCGVLASDVTVAPTVSYTGGTWHARHWNRKDNVLEPVAVVRANLTLGTRRDRRAPRPTNALVTV